MREGEWTKNKSHMVSWCCHFCKSKLSYFATTYNGERKRKRAEFVKKFQKLKIPLRRPAAEETCGQDKTTTKTVSRPKYPNQLLYPQMYVQRYILGNRLRIFHSLYSRRDAGRSMKLNFLASTWTSASEMV